MEYVYVYIVHVIQKCLWSKNSRVLVWLISPNIPGTDFLTKYPDDANKENEVHLENQQ